MIRIALLLALCLSTVTIAQESKPAPKQQQQQPDVAAPKIDGKTGEPQEAFMAKHADFLKRAKEGNVDILFLGDSITAGWASTGKDVWAKRYADRKAANFGIGGDRTQHVLWRSENGELEAPIKPKVIVLMIGTNNSAADPGDKIAAGVEKIVATAREKTGAKVLLLAIFPRGETAMKAATQRSAIAVANERIAKLDDGKNVRFLDLSNKFQKSDGTISKEIMPDYLHLSKQGYEIWADGMEPLLTEMLQH
jgi:lysophospholipase L1-like esterase